MSLIFELPRILEDSKKEYEKIKAAASVKSPFVTVEEHGASGNILARGDNLDFMKYLLDERDMAGQLQLVYMDPPFYSNASYDAVIKLKSPVLDDEPTIKPMAYDDHWKTGMEDYLRMLCVRFYMIKDLLSDEGCFWVHLDWHVVHYVKILMDEIFGADNFVNEVIWNYKSGGTGKRNFSRKHDTLLFYSKSKKYYFNPLQEKSYNRGFKPYRFKGVEEFQDEMGWYTMVNMKDVWQLDMVGRTSSERTGYATQKPETLLARIIESCSREGDLCADFFSGSGTLAATAEKLGRRWIACDIGGIATASCLKRLSAKESNFTVMEQVPENLLIRSVVDSNPEQNGPIVCKLSGAGNCELITANSIRGNVPQDELSLAEGYLSPNKENRAYATEITIELLEYKLDIKHVPVQGSDRETIKKFRRKDSLQLLEYWSVDFDYDGFVHKPQQVFTKENHTISKTCRHKIETAGNAGDSSARDAGCSVDPGAARETAALHKNAQAQTKDGPRRISIRAVDIFGNSTLKVIEI